MLAYSIPEMYISEIQDDPLFGDRDTDQYVELRGAPNSTIPDGTFFVVVEGWGAVPGGPGYVHSVIDLSNLKFGANGFLTVTQLGSPYQVDSQSTRLTSSTVGFSGLPDGRWNDASSLSDRFSFISGSQSFLLIGAGSKPVSGDDYDLNDDGTLDNGAALWTTYDSVAMMGFSSPGWSYGRITFSHNTVDHRYPAGSVYTVQENIGYVARIGSSTGYAASDWVCGTTIEDTLNANSKYRFTYGTFGDPRPLVYSGRATNNVGTYNFGGGFLGRAMLDVDRDGQFTDSDTPLANVTVFADRNDNGIRDNTTIDVISSQQTLGAELANVFPNATLTVADSNNKNIGFAVRTAQKNDNAGNPIRVLSSEGIPWFDNGSRLKVMFYREANAVSIEAIAAETLKYSFGRIDIYDKNDTLLGSRSTLPLIGTDRQTIGFSRPTADIKYAIIFTDTTPPDSSPFGPFDKLRYSYPEFQATTGSDGSIRMQELPTGTYRLSVSNYPGNLIPITANSTTPLTVNRSEHLTNITFGYKDNLPPEILSSQFNIPENPATNAVVATVLASDPDAGQSLSYRFTTNSGPFSIDQVTGEIRYTGNGAWDYETTRELNVQVEVRDSLPIPGTVRKFIKLVNLDRNESPSLQGANFTIDENAPSGTVVGTVTGSDPDAGINGQLIYQLGVGAPAGTFSIDETTGRITVASPDLLDFETRPVISLPVVVRDKATPPLSGSASVLIHLRDVNEVPTGVSFTELVSISENTSVILPIKVATVSVVDDALGTNSLSLSGPDASHFVLIGNELKFQSATPLDFETKSVYRVIVSADDATLGSTPDVSVPFELGITDVNEKPTGIVFSNVVNPLLETTSVSTAVRVADIAALDDAIGNNILSLGSTLDASFFQIVGNQLQFRSAAPLDFETKSSYRVVVQVDDAAFPGFPDAASTFTLSIGDVNEPPVDLRLNNPVTLINETNGVSAGQTIATIVVVDDSSGTNELTLEGPDAGYFEISANLLRLKSGSPLNFEVKPFYDVAVRLTDPSLPGSPTLSRSLRVNISNRPEVVSISDVSGSPLGERIQRVRLSWDVELGPIPADAISVVKKDVGFVAVPYTSTRSLIDGRTVVDLAFGGSLADPQGFLIDGVYEVFVTGSKVTAAGTNTTGLSYNSGSLSVMNPALPAFMQITGNGLLFANQKGAYQVTLGGLTSPPQVIQYDVDLNGDGTIDRNLSAGTSLSIPEVSFSQAGSYTMKVTAKSGSEILSASSFAIAVSPETSSTENWLSAMDTDRDTSISPLDVLVVINSINAGGGRYNFDYDVDRDENISPLDVLIVINYLNTSPVGRADTLGNLSMAESGGNSGITADRTINGRILTNTRSLYASLDGSDRLDISDLVAQDGSFLITDQVFGDLFGIIPDGTHVLSLATKSGTTFSSAMDKRFLNLRDHLNAFSFVSLVGRNGQLRTVWSPSATGAKYNVLVGPSGGTLSPLRVGLSDTSLQTELASGVYDIQIEAVDAAGNKRLSEKRTVTI
ncbi:MAG: cadherin domain-containing protein [Pirellula sp.]